MSVERQFTERGLAFARQNVDFAACGLVPVNDPGEWELFAEDRTGAHRHAWLHRKSGWLSQTLSVPRDVLEAPEKARAWLGGGV